MATASASASRAARLRETGLDILTGRILFGLVALALFPTVIWWNVLGKPWGPGTSAALAYGLFALHVVLVFRRVSSMDPLIWTPFALLLFYFGEPVVIEWMQAAAPTSYDPWRGGNALYVDRGFAASLLAVAAFLWGVHLAGVRPLGGAPRRGAVQDRSLGTTALLFTLGAVGMVAIGIAIVGPGAVFGYYSNWWDAKLLGADQRFVDMGMVFAEAGVFALLATDEPGARWRRWFAYAVAAVVMVIAIQKGDRTGLIALGVGAGWCYTQRVGRLRWPLVLAAAFTALVMMPVIGEWRSQRSLEESQRAGVYQLLANSFYNMGSSVNALVFTAELVPSQKDYSWGRTFWYAALNAIPNVAPTKGKSFATGSLEDTPSTWITWVISPEAAARNFGYGFSMAAEWHYNFGPAGVLLGMALTGWFMTRARNASGNSSLALVWSATLFAATVIWVRNVVGYALKVAVWPIIGLWLIYRLVLLLRGRGKRRPAKVANVAAEPFTP